MRKILTWFGYPVKVVFMRPHGVEARPAEIVADALLATEARPADGVGVAAPARDALVGGLFARAGVVRGAGGGRGRARRRGGLAQARPRKVELGRSSWPGAATSATTAAPAFRRIGREAYQLDVDEAYPVQTPAIFPPYL